MKTDDAFLYIESRLPEMSNHNIDIMTGFYVKKIKTKTEEKDILAFKHVQKSQGLFAVLKAKLEKRGCKIPNLTPANIMQSGFTHGG